LREEKMEKVTCGSCGAPVSGVIDVCNYCGEPVAGMSPGAESPGDAPMLDEAWVQGMTADGRPNGSYDTINLDPISLQDATRILEKMGFPPADPIDPDDICPAILGFGMRQLYCKDGEYVFFDEINDPGIGGVVSNPGSVLAEIYRTKNGQLDVARLKLSNPNLSAAPLAEMAELRTDNDSDGKSSIGSGHVFAFLILILAIGFGGYRFIELSHSVDRTVQQLLRDNAISLIVDEINLPITLVLANRVTADVFLKKEPEGYGTLASLGRTHILLRSMDVFLRIEVIVIPKGAIPILSIFTGMEVLVEIPRTEMFKLQNSQ
jgi:hypothetical protein